MKSLLYPMLTALMVGVAFFAGQAFDRVDAQGRTGPPTPRPPQPDPAPPVEHRFLPYESGDTAGASSNGFIAVTGSYGVGTSVLYLIDTDSRQIAVYEARGGSKSMRRLVLIGARRIDLDLQLEGYNDESEYDYESLRRMFESGERAPAPTRSEAEGFESR